MHFGLVLHPASDVSETKIRVLLRIESPPDPPKNGGGNGRLSKLVILWLWLFLLRFFGRFGPELHRNVKIPW